MPVYQAIVLGIVQGLAEFLPISSSAHLLIVGQFLGTGEDPGARFTAITQIGTELAVVIFFWRDIVRIVTQWVKSLVGKAPRNDPDARMGWLIIIGSIPIVVLGLLFQDQIETVLRNLWITAIMLIVFGILLGIADAVGAKRRRLWLLRRERFDRRGSAWRATAARPELAPASTLGRPRRASPPH